MASASSSGVGVEEGLARNWGMPDRGVVRELVWRFLFRRGYAFSVSALVLLPVAFFLPRPMIDHGVLLWTPWSEVNRAVDSAIGLALMIGVAWAVFDRLWTLGLRALRRSSRGSAKG